MPRPMNQRRRLNSFTIRVCRRCAGYLFSSEQNVEASGSHSILNMHLRTRDWRKRIWNKWLNRAGQNELLLANSLVAKRPLSIADRFRLDAINATATRDFPAAIASYQKIVDQSAAGEKANDYSDLGRAYERNEQTDKAIENYSRATTLDAQAAGPFFDLGIAYSRRRDASQCGKSL